MNLTLAFSPCPNDCFMFDAVVNRRIDLEGLQFDVRLADVEALNKAAFAREVDVTKLSYHAYAYCAADYVLLDAGSALGRNCGPLLISKRTFAPADVTSGTLRIAGIQLAKHAPYLEDLTRAQLFSGDGEDEVGVTHFEEVKLVLGAAAIALPQPAAAADADQRLRAVVIERGAEDR